MREKELRLALICYGGVSLAIYMHGVTKEIWRLARASRGMYNDEGGPYATEAAYQKLFRLIEAETETTVRVLPDIIAGASAGGINGIFLAQAIATGQSLEPLTALWLDNADVDQLLDPDARPWSAFTKFWAIPIAWIIAGRRGGTLHKTVSKAARAEVRLKLSNLVRARWFAPPFGGAGFVRNLLDAFDAMASGPSDKRLLPYDQPLDLFVTVTDYAGFPQQLRLNSPSKISETEHRITLSFRDTPRTGVRLGDAAELVFAARATASFPGAFPPFNVAELDGVLTARNRIWTTRGDFLMRVLPGHASAEAAARTVLIDGSVLANAPFKPAVDALRDRPARREIDRRFVYIDPKPSDETAVAKMRGTALPGFMATIFAALSDIPREQPIRDSLEAIEARSMRIRRMQRIIEALRPGVEGSIESMFGHTFFLDSPTPARIKTWRQKAQSRAASDAGFAFDAYGHLKLSAIVEDMAGLVARQHLDLTGEAFEAFRQSLWTEVRARGADMVAATSGKGASEATITFFRAHDLGFRIRRLRSVIRTVARLSGERRLDPQASEPVREALFAILSRYLDREGVGFYQRLSPAPIADLLNDIALQRDLTTLDAETDAALAVALSHCPKAERRIVLLAYLGFPFYDISTLPMLQGEGLDEFDPIKVDRISPEDATMIRCGTQATLKGIEFNNFGAFFSRSYRENDYLWGRLHGADRLFDIVASTVPALPAAARDAIKRELLIAVLDDEEPRLTKIPDLFTAIRAEIAALPVTA
jgi:patatin-related protein